MFKVKGVNDKNEQRTCGGDKCYNLSDKRRYCKNILSSDKWLYSGRTTTNAVCLNRNTVKRKYVYDFGNIFQSKQRTFQGNKTIQLRVADRVGAASIVNASFKEVAA